MRYKHGKSETLEYYQILVFSFKYYNKWYMSTEAEFRLMKDVTNRANTPVLARMMEKVGSSYDEAKLEKYGE